MKFLRVLTGDLKRAVFSWKFLLSTLCMTAVMPLSVANFLSSGENTVFYLIDLFFGSGLDGPALCILPLLSYGLSYAGEWNGGMDRLLIVRAGRGRYILSKILACAVSGFLTVFCGMLLLIVMLGTTHPLYRSGYCHTYITYGQMIAEGRVFQGYFLYLIHWGLSGALTAVCALWVSAWRTNGLLAATAPFLLYFTATRICSRITLPGWLDPVYWYAVYNVGTAGKTLAIRMAVVFLLCGAMGLAAAYHINRRLRNE